jgi:hypothetical protein
MLSLFHVRTDSAAKMEIIFAIGTIHASVGAWASYVADAVLVKAYPYSTRIACRQKAAFGIPLSLLSSL